jgi:hypothetical protein
MNEYRPSGDQNPEGRAAKRRRKQMARQGLLVNEPTAADSCEAPRADRQNLPSDWAYGTPINEFAGGYYNHSTRREEELARLVARREIEHTEQQIHMTILDDVGPVPAEVWGDTNRLEETREGAHPRRRVGTIGLGRPAILAAALIAMMGNEPPKK